MGSPAVAPCVPLVDPPRQTKVIGNQVHPAGAAPIDFGDFGQTLGKNQSRTSDGTTSKSPHRNPDDDGTTMARHIVQCTAITAVHRSRSRPADRTHPVSSAGPGMNDDLVILDLMALDQEVVWN